MPLATSAMCLVVESSDRGDPNEDIGAFSIEYSSRTDQCGD